METRPLYNSTELLYSAQMPREEVEKLLLELREWADRGYGRRSELAQMLGVSKQLVSEWFSGRSVPTWGHGLAIAAFLKKQRRRANRLFLFDVLAALPQGMDGPWGKVLVQSKFSGNPSSARNLAGMAALAAGQKKWGKLVRLFADLVPQECTCDLSKLPESDYENDFGRAWILLPEQQAQVHLVEEDESRPTSIPRFRLSRQDREIYHEKEIEFLKLPINRGPAAGYRVSGQGKLKISTNGVEGRADIFVDQWFGDHGATSIFHLPEDAFRSIKAVGNAFLLDWSDKA